MSVDSMMRRFKLRMKKRIYTFDKNRWLKKNKMELEKFEKEQLYSMLETLQQVEQGKSLARFGDGEITLIDGDNIDFQNADQNMSAELAMILKNQQSELIVCLPTILTACNSYEENWWLKFWYVRWLELKPKLNHNQKYGHSMVTRPDFFALHHDLAIQAWKKIWDNKSVLFITGEGSRLNLAHTLFDNVLQKTQIYSLASNAYQDLNRLMHEISIQEQYKDSLILIALGPSGTVLAYRLALNGYHALDVGHISSSYDEVYCAI